VRVVRRWSEIEERIKSKPGGPWFVAINDNGLKDMNV
jgi:hypothetical protein